MAVWVSWEVLGLVRPGGLWVSVIWGPGGVLGACLSVLLRPGERIWLSAEAPEWDAPAALGAEGCVCATCGCVALGPYSRFSLYYRVLNFALQ